MKDFTNYMKDRAQEGSNYAKSLSRRSKKKTYIETALKDAQKEGIAESVLDEVKIRAAIDGSFDITPDLADKIIETLSSTSRTLFKRLDPIKDADLIAIALLCDPEIRKKFGNDRRTLYEVSLNSGFKKNRKNTSWLGERYGCVDSSSLVDYFKNQVKGLFSNIPAPKSNEDEENQRALQVLLTKKAERDIFPIFKNDQERAFKVLDQMIAEEDEERVREVYIKSRDTYKGYAEFETIGVNENFKDPETGEKGVLPSLHQLMALYKIKNEKKFGVFDGCGTGKTAIAILAQPLIKQEFEKAGKEFRRTLVVCPNGAKKAWKKGLLGNKYERYLEEKSKKKEVFVINGEIKNDEFQRKLKDAKWIIVNYEQLTTKVNGNGKFFYEQLIDLGVDYSIFDESHHIKTRRKYTKGGKPTHSLAAQEQAHSSEYLTLLTGSPIPDKLVDYSVPYHLLNPEICPTPEDFIKLYKNDPRMLFLFFNEKAIRRTSEDINENLKWEEREQLVDMDSLQKRIYEHIRDTNPQHALIQARKALLDPRLVDPAILQATGTLGKVNYTHSSKYKKLEEILTSDNGPIAKGEKFIIFSSMFKEGVTNSSNENLRKRYIEFGIDKEFYEASGLESRILFNVLADNLSSIKTIEKKLSPKKTKKKNKKEFEKECEEFKEKYNKSLSDLISKGYVLTAGNKITVNIKEDGAVRRSIQMYDGLEFDVSLSERISKILEDKFGKPFDIGIIDGDEKLIESREKTVDGLKNGLDGILCTTKTGGESLDFSAASYAIFLDEDYTPTTMEQAFSRLIRKGQLREVIIDYLRGKNTVDEKLRDHIRKKRITNTMATDGYEITDEERKLLEDTKGKLLWKSELEEARTGSIGGESIDVYAAEVLDIYDFETKGRRKRKGKSVFNRSEDLVKTGAQIVSEWIGRDPLGCWKDQNFVELYMREIKHLSVPLVHRAKIMDLVMRAKEGQIKFPEKVLSEGSGPSLLYNEYHSLTEILKKHRYEIPTIFDRDTSELMLKNGKNPNKIHGCMTGRNSKIEPVSFDMVDNESISLLQNSGEVKQSILEANRILKQDGLLELVLQNMEFAKDFYSGLEKLGFEVLSKNKRFSVTKDNLRRMKKEQGERYAATYAGKLANTNIVLAQKKDRPADASDNHFWFERIVPEETTSEEPERRVETAEPAIGETVSPKPSTTKSRDTKTPVEETEYKPRRLAKRDPKTGLAYLPSDEGEW